MISSRSYVLEARDLSAVSVQHGSSLIHLALDLIDRSSVASRAEYDSTKRLNLDILVQSVSPDWIDLKLCQ